MGVQDDVEGVLNLHEIACAVLVLCSLQELIHRIMSREKPDVLHCTMDGMSPFLVLSAKLLSIPVVGSIHTDVLVSLGAFIPVFVGTSVAIWYRMERDESSHSPKWGGM